MYLCGGTFLTQLLRAKKENLPEQEVFRKLISIYQLKDFFKCSSLKTYTSKFKSCSDSLEAFTLFSDNDMKRAFDEDVRSNNSMALSMMSELVSEFLDKYVQIVRCLLDMIQTDETIDRSEKFYISGRYISKAELNNTDTFVIENFLLGVWHFIIMKRSGCNEKGSETYRQWYPSRGVYVGSVGNAITRPISVRSAASKADAETKTPAVTANNEYYNLIISSELDFRDIQAFTLTSDRVLTEYMFENHFDIEEAKTFPCIFANENNTDANQICGFGYIQKLKSRREAVKIYPNILCFFPQQKLNDHAFDLDIQRFELNRNHWCVKKVDLISELREFGIV